MVMEIKKKVSVRERNMGNKQTGDTQIQKNPSRVWCEG